jgi:hypothetical protein
MLGGSLLLCAPFVACSGSDFKQDDAAPTAGAGGAGATSNNAGQTSAGSQNAGSGTAGVGSGGSSASGGNAGSSTTGGRSGASAGAEPSSAGGDAAGGAGDLPGISTDGLVLWFKADAGVMIDGGGISQWTDQSGNGHDATQPDASSRPKLSSSASSALPVIELDGVDDHFELPDFIPPLGDGLSFFAVAARSHDSTCSGLLELSNGSEIDDVSFDSLGNSFQFEVVSSTAYAAADAFPQGELRLIEALQTADPIQPMADLRANGAQVGSGKVQAPLSVLRADNQIGDSLYADCSPFPGAIGEIILYGRHLDTAERVAVETYLKQKWQCCN